MKAASRRTFEKCVPWGHFIKGNFFLRGGDETFVFPREKTCQFTHTRLSFNRSLNWVNNRKLPCKKDSVWQEEQSWLKGFLPPRAVLQSCKKRRNVFSFVSCHYFYSSHFFCFHLWYEHEKEALTPSLWKITHHVSFEFLFTPLLYSVQTFEFCWPCCKMTQWDFSFDFSTV